jgi:glycosyltransferase involved in cell wall biosynthesis
LRGYEYFTAPFTVRRDVLEEFSKEIRTFNPQMVWLDYLFIGQYIQYFRERGIPTVYGTHNAQSRLTWQQVTSERHLLERIKFFTIFLLHVIHERTLLARADSLICVSEQDKQFYKRFIPEDKIEVLLNFVNVDHYGGIEPIRRDKPYLVFVGSLDNFQNLQGILFFLERIWDSVRRATRDLQICIVGRGCRNNRKLVEMENRTTDILLFDNVDTVVPYIKGAVASIVPLLHGSGTRLKIVESMCCHTPVVSTARGAEGISAIPGKEILIANTPGQFADSLLMLVKNSDIRNSISVAAYEYVRTHYGFEAAKAIVEKIIRQTVPNRAASAK